MDLYEKSKKTDEFFLITRYVSRRLAYPLAVLCHRAGLSANAVTIVGGLLWIASVPTLIGAGLLMQAGECHGGWALLIATVVLWNLGYILDVVDGSLARMTNTAGAAGYFLDFSFHLVFQPMFLCSIGIFLFLLTGHPAWLPLAILSICCNWGVSFAAKEHVLCEDMAKCPDHYNALADEERYAILIDSPRMKTPAEQKTGRGRLALDLTQEIITFPGQFTFFGLVILADAALMPWLGHRLVLLQLVFAGVMLVSLIRVPFRLRREYRTMRRYDRLVQADEATPAPGPETDA